MADLKNCLKVTHLPPAISEDELRIIFQNKRNKGGGPIDKIIVDRSGNPPCALICFKKEEAIETILARGNTITIDDHIVRVSKHVSDVKKETTRPKTAKPKPIEAQQTSRKMSQAQATNEMKIHKISDQSKGTYTAQNFNSYEEKDDEPDIKMLVKCTIKATVIDIWKSKDSYILYLEDSSISQGNFYEDSLLLDCLNKVLYVTFENEDGAMKTCKWRHGPDSNFARVEMSTEADFDTYPNKVSIHGLSLKHQAMKNAFLEFVYKETGLEVQNLIQWNEHRSAILEFSENDCDDVSEICWILKTDFKGTRILTAPVFKTKSVSVKGFPSGYDKCLLQRYFSNQRSGGGVVESVVMQGNWAIVTFQSEESFTGVLRKKDHYLENHKLEIEECYECLSSSTFKKSYSSKSLTMISSKSEEMDWKGTKRTVAAGSGPDVQSDDEEDTEYYDFPDAEEHSSELEKSDLILLKNTNILKELQQMNKTVKITIDQKNSKAIFQGEHQCSIKAQTELMQFSVKRFKSEKLNSLSKNQLELLQIDSLQQEINAEFQEGKRNAVFLIENEDALIYFVKPAKVEELAEIVKNFAHEETKNLSDPNAKLLFTSKLGRDFLLSLHKLSDGSSVLVKYNEQNNSLLIVGPQKRKAELHQRIGDFLRENVTDLKNIKCSEGKIKFLKKHKKDEVIALKEKFKPLGVIFTENPTGFEVRGKKDEVLAAEKELFIIIDSVFAEDFSLKFFGIKEYMLEKEGKFLKTGIENGLACCISLPTGPSSYGSGQGKAPEHKAALIPLEPIPPPQVIATANFDFFTLHFVQGNLLGLQVQAIVNPLDETKQLNVGGLGKAISVRGGGQIQTDLQNISDSELVTVTNSGNLKMCKQILHVALGKFNSDSGGNVETAMSSALKCAHKNRFTSIGFPCMGNGMCVQTMNAIKKFLTLESTCPGDIYICDKSGDMLSSLIDRCEQTFDVLVDHRAELEHKPKEVPIPKPRKSSRSASAQAQDFGNLQLKLVQGEITKWRIDAIVIACDKSLDLKKGMIAKLILRFGGDSVQQELNDNHPDGISPGQFAQSTGGNLKCKYIFYTCFTHWKDGNGPQQAQQMQSTIEDILKAADGLGLASVALPALGTGNLNYPKDVVAKVFCDALSNYAKNNPSSKLNIDLVIYPKDTEVFDAFQDQFTSLKSAQPKSLNRGQKEEEEEDDDDHGDEDNKSGASFQGAFEFVKSATAKVFSMMTGGGNNKMSCGSVSLTISKGDITKEKCDAIVCSIKNSMDLSASGAVCKNLFKICGSSLQAECNNQQTAMQQTGVAKTSASGLPCQSIFFVSMEKFSTSWDKGVFDVLTEAETAGATSIALPLLGSGAKSPNMDLIKKRFLAGVERFGKSKNASLKDIRLIIFSNEMYDFFVGKAAQSPDPTKHDKSPSKEMMKPKHKVSDRVDLKLYCNDSAHADRIRKELISIFKERFHQSKVENEKIKQLNPKQISEIKACDSRVDVTVRHEEGIVFLRSFFPTTKVMNKLSTLMLEAVESHHRNVIEATPAAIAWQYQEKDDKWKNFEPLLNAEIEKEYKNKSVHCVVTDSQKRKYKLDFSSMVEFSFNKDGSLSKQGAKIRRFDKTKTGEPLPKRWDQMGGNNLKLVQIQNGGEEFKNVQLLFQKGGVTSPIKSIQRIQNKFLYQQYMVKKREMDQRNGKGFNNEMRLFHGTSPTSMTAINANGFSNNYAGAHATAYGNGTYFAVQSSYSQGYCQQDTSGQKHMYLARVLVGKSTISNSSMKYLPTQPGSNTPFDSGTDGNNVMYIIFHDAQTYPEYLISF